MQQKTLMGCAVAAACIAMASGAFAAEYTGKNETVTPGATQLFGHVSSTQDVVTSTDDVFKDNKLTFATTGGSNTAVGIAVSQTSATIKNGTFTNNVVVDSEGSLNGVYGTAVGVTGSADSVLTIEGSTFTDNTGTSYKQTQGGAVYQSIGTASIKKSTFTGNKAEGVKDTAAYAMGGAAAFWGTTVTIDGSVFKNNTAISSMKDKDNVGGSLGGAVYLRSGRWGGADHISAKITNTTFEGNQAVGNAANGGALYVKSDYDADNKKKKKYLIDVTLENVSFKNNSSSAWGGAMYVQGEGALTMKNVTFEGNKAVYGSALAVYGNKANEAHLDDVEAAKVVATNVDYLNNHNDSYGATLWLYTKTDYQQTGGSFVGNKTTGSGDVLAGGVFVKGASAVFTDVLFENNTAESTGGVAAGGAVYVDIVQNDTAGTVPGTVKFVVTKDMTYSGNHVVGKDDPTDTYGYLTASAGGFLLLDRGTSAEFDVAEGATLTIGKEGSTGQMDSIASAYPKAANQNTATITKSGAGALVVNSDMNRYYGKVDVNAGRMEVNTAWSMRDAVTINGGTLALTSFNFDKMPDPLSLVGSITVKTGGTLETSSAQLFTNGLGDGSVEDAGAALKAGKVTVEAGGSIALTDAKYNLAYLSTLNGKYTNAKYVLLGELADSGKVTLDDLASVDGGKILNAVEVSSEDKNVQIGGTTVETGYAHRGDSLGVATFDLGTANKILVTGGETLTLTGAGEDGKLVKSTAEDPLYVTVKDNATLLLGGTEYAKGGVLAGTVDVETTGTLTATGGKAFTVDTVTGAGNVLVGEDKTAGKLVIGTLDNFTGTIFVDPAWLDDVEQDVIGNASHLEISSAKDALAGTLVAGRNSLVSIGAGADEAAAAFERIAAIQGLAWGPDDVTAALYLAGPVTVTGKIVVDGSLTGTSQIGSSYADAGKVYVANKGILIVDQAKGSADTAMISGALDVAANGYVGVLNATEGTFKLADTLTGSGEVVTDNPFVDGRLNTENGTLENKLNASSGLSALASLGIQSMARRADFTLSETIADRTAVDQELHAGVNLWADVSGEHYEADGLANGAEFKADMGYGAFGGDVAFGEGFTAGAAFQYGQGTLRSSVSSIRNEIDSYGFALYGAKSFGDSKVVAEASYLWTENDVTASQTALNQSVDAGIWSVGVRGQHAFKAGAFTFTPSVGVRYSHLETDAMTIGAVNVEKQKQDLIQVPLALRITAGETNACGWQLAPAFKIAYVPTFGDKEIKVLGHETDVIDTNPVQGSMGLRAQQGNLLLNVDFAIGGGKDGASSIGGKVGVKYAF